MTKFLLIICLFLSACCSVVQDRQVKAQLAREVEIVIPYPEFFMEYRGEILLTTEYEGTKKSILIAEEIRKDSLALQVMSVSYINLFKANYTGNGLQTEYQVPQSLLPPVNQSLLDIMLSYGTENVVKKSLPTGYVLIQQQDLRLIKDNSGKIIYSIEYDPQTRLVTRISNYEFGYCIDIKYL